MSIRHQQPSDLRAKAGEYRDKAARVHDSELHDQFLNLAHRYLEMAEQLERNPFHGPFLPRIEA